MRRGTHLDEGETSVRSHTTPPSPPDASDDGMEDRLLMIAAKRACAHSLNLIDRSVEFVATSGRGREAIARTLVEISRRLWGGG